MIKIGKDILRDARKSSLLTQSDVAGLLGVSVPTVVAIEQDPEQTNLRTLKVMYENYSTDGKEAIRKWTASFFDE